MMIIPAIDLMDGQVVRLYRGDPGRKTVYGSDPVAVALEWERQGADMLHLVNLDATLGRGDNRGVVRRILDAVSMPVQVAGGLRDVESVRAAAAMADRAVIGTLAFESPDLLEDLRVSPGPDRIVISADHKDGKVVTRGWQNPTAVDLIGSIERFMSMGFGDFLVTDVGRDGTMEGPELDYLRQACRTGARVIASGGISGVEDVEHVMECGASGVILGRAIYDGKITIAGAAKWR